MKSLLPMLLVAALLAGLPGCGKTKDADTPETPDTTKLKVPGNQASGKDWSNPQSYFTNDVIAAVAIHPKQVWDSPLLQEILGEMFTPEELEKEVKKSLPPDLPIDIRTIEEIVVVVDSHQVEGLMQGPKRHTMESKKVDVSKLSQAELEEHYKKEDARWEKEMTARRMENNSHAPLFVVRCSSPFDPENFFKSKKTTPVEKTHAGVSYREDLGLAFLFVDDKTLVTGSEGAVKRAIDSKGSQSNLAKSFTKLTKVSDLGLVVDIESKKEELQKLIGNLPPVPGKGMILNIKNISLKLKPTGSEGDTLLALDAEMNTPENAKAFSGMLNGMLAMGKEGAKQGSKGISADLDADGKKAVEGMVKELSDNFNFTDKENHLMVNLPIPKGYSNLPNILKPAIAIQKKRIQDSKYKNSLKMIGLALHNYNETFSHFPRANGDGEGTAVKGTGLSWRVHLLSFLDYDGLKKKFHMDEPWDSPHNKTLINQMPDIFKTPDVTDPTKTTYQVFVGKGSPFENEKRGLRYIEVRDGMSNTILAIQTGADKAEVWTKPGGVLFNPKNPMPAIGTIEGKGFRVLMGDGRVFKLRKNIDAKTFSAVITHNGGEKVDVDAARLESDSFRRIDKRNRFKDAKEVPSSKKIDVPAKNSKDDKK